MRFWIYFVVILQAAVCVGHRQFFSYFVFFSFFLFSIRYSKHTGEHGKCIKIEIKRARIELNIILKFKIEITYLFFILFFSLNCFHFNLIHRAAGAISGTHVTFASLPFKSILMPSHWCLGLRDCMLITILRIENVLWLCAVVWVAFARCFPSFTFDSICRFAVFSGSACNLP